jgi:hypothetical protein
MDEVLTPEMAALRKLRASAIEPIPLADSYLGSFKSRDIPADARPDLGSTPRAPINKRGGLNGSLLQHYLIIGR